MKKLIDFSEDKIIPRTFGGSDRKFRILHDGKFYMLKFTEEHVKKTELSTSHENNAISECISSHIAKSVGLDVHNTLLGTYKGEICVACEDFRGMMDENMEFVEFARQIYGASEFKKVPRLEQVYAVIESDVFPEDLKEKAIERFWDTFIVDAFVANFDRHAGNWGLLLHMELDGSVRYRLAPVYDFGSTLFPIMSDDAIPGFLASEFEMKKRCLVFPSADIYLTAKKCGKPGYYDMLSSGYDENCTKALLRMFPKIDLEKVFAIIDDTPAISEVRRHFYKNILKMRYEIILQRAYECCASRAFDREALGRLQAGVSIDDKFLAKMLQKEKEIEERDF
jgi:hypothetical protein